MSAEAFFSVMPDGWRYEQEFIDIGEERQLLGELAGLPFKSAPYKQWTARRRIVSFGGSYDFTSNRVTPSPPVPAFLLPIRARAAEWAQVPDRSLTHAMVNEYAPAAPLGWHRDVPEFQEVIGMSLLGHGRMRFRPYPPAKGQRTVFSIELAPRSIYVLRGAARWNWQHAISPTKELRYSVTFRSRRLTTV